MNKWNQIPNFFRILIIFIVLLSILATFFFIRNSSYFLFAEEVVVRKKKISDPLQVDYLKKSLANLSIDSEYALLYDLETSETLYEKNANEQMFPASITKVLTAFVALDAVYDVQQLASVSENDLAHLFEDGASVAGFQMGDTLSYEQAIYAMILASGADAANFLANHISGSLENFIEEMNQKAKAIGMLNTQMSNPTGIHNDQHYTTLHDLKKMMVYAWKNPVMRKVLTSLTYQIDSLASHPNGLALQNSLLTYDSDLNFEGGVILGGKSGYTYEAECCLLSIAQLADGHQYILISGKASGIPQIDHQHVNDAKNVYASLAQAKAAYESLK